MDFELTPVQKDLQERMAAFRQREWPPELMRELNIRGEFPLESWRRMSREGWFSLRLPPEAGGVDCSASELVAVAEEIGKVSTDLVAAFTLTLSGSHDLWHYGTRAAKDEFLPRIQRGDLHMVVSVTEASAGSDARGIRTVAQVEGDELVINGEKLFCENSGHSDVLIELYCRMVDKDTKKPLIGTVLVPSWLPGVSFHRSPLMGRTLTGVYDVVLQEVRLPEHYLLGGLHGGWGMLLDRLLVDRLILAGGFLSAARSVLDEIEEHCRRAQTGMTQALAHKLVNLNAQCDAARLLTYRAAWLLDRNQPCEREVGMVKAMSAEIFLAAARKALQVIGEPVYAADHSLALHYLDACAGPIVSGSVHIQRNLAARAMQWPVTG